MPRFAWVAPLVAAIAGCGAHLHRPLDHELARGAAAQVEGLEWDEAFALDRGQRDANAARELELSYAYADARREAELLEILTEPVGARSWTKLEDRFVELGACMLSEAGSNSGRACRGRVEGAQREAARALLFDACPAQGCAWVAKVGALRSASAGLSGALAAYDRARGLAGLSDAVASPAQCPAPTRAPTTLAVEGERLAGACVAYERALEAVAEVLPESSGLRSAIGEYRALARVRDDYRESLRLLVAEFSALRFAGQRDVAPIEASLAHHLGLQAQFAAALAGAEWGEFGDLALEGTLLVAREHRAAVIRLLATLDARRAVADRGRKAPARATDPAAAPDPAVTLRSAEAPSSEPPSSEPPDPGPTDPRPPSSEPPDPEPPRPEPPRPGPGDRTPDAGPEPVEPPGRRPIPSDADPAPGPSPTVERADRALVQQVGDSLAPIFGQTWRTLQDQRRDADRGALLLSAELERIQIDAMSRRLAFAEDRVYLELAAIETQLLALVRLRSRLDAQWIPATRPPSAALDQLEALRVEYELARAAHALAEAELRAAIDRTTGKSGKAGGAVVGRELVADATRKLDEAQAGLDAAADAHHEHLAEHGAAVCRRSGTFAQTYARDPACAGPIEGLVGLHAELVGVALPRLEALERRANQRRDEAVLVRDEAGLELRVTSIAASVLALQRFTAGGLEPRDVAAILGAVAGIGLGAAITAGVYIP